MNSSGTREALVHGPFFCMYCQHSGAAFRRFIPRFRRSSGSRLTPASGLPTLASLAAHFEMRRYQKQE
jgi:hypothetical protein